MSALPQGRWSVDPDRSTVTFTVKHMMLTKVNGSFTAFAGMLELGPGVQRASGTVEASSIDTGEEVRDEHVRRSPDFFDVERHPQISFDSTLIELVDDGRLRILGELSMRGVSREIELDARVAPAASEPTGESERIELDVRGELNRRDFGLTWNQALETGGALLGNRVKIALRVSAMRESETAPSARAATLERSG